MNNRCGDGTGTMGGLDDLLAQSNKRWASATRRAHGLADKGLGDAVRVYYTRFFPVGLPVLLLAGTLTGTLAFGAEPADWPRFLAFGCVLALLGAAIGGFVYNAKRVRPAADAGRIDVLLSLESHEQKHLRSQVLGTAPLEPEHLAVARGAAVQIRKSMATQLVLAPIYPLAFVPQAVNFLMRGDAVIGWVMVALVIALFVGAGLLIRDFRRAGEFLERTAAQAGSGNTAP